MNVEGKVESKKPAPSPGTIPTIDREILRSNLHDLRILNVLNLRWHTIDTSSIIATLYVNRTDAGAVSTRQRTVTPHSRDGLVDCDSWHCYQWRCRKWWPGVGHIHCDIPGIRFVEVPRALSTWDVLDPR